MSTVLDSPADNLRTTMAAVRVSISWFGTRKSLTTEQKAEAVEPFNAEAKFLSAGKKLLDISHPAFKAVTAVRGKVIAYWKSMSLPYPEPGIRLIRQQKIDAFATQMREFQDELAEAVQGLDLRYSELKAAARRSWAACTTPAITPIRSAACSRSASTFHPLSHQTTSSSSTRSFTKRVSTRAVPFRRGRSSGGGSLHRRTRQTDLASHRATLRER